MKFARVPSPLICLLLCACFAHAANPEGILPVSKDGKPLNFDFEDGTLRDWIATGANP